MLFKKYPRGNAVLNLRMHAYMYLLKDFTFQCTLKIVFLHEFVKSNIIYYIMF